MNYYKKNLIYQIDDHLVTDNAIASKAKAKNAEI